MRVLPILLVTGLTLVTASCDDGGSGSREAFCERIVAANAALSQTDYRDAAEAQAAIDTFRDLAEVAPGSIDADVRRMAELVEELKALDWTKQESYAESLSAAVAPSVLNAAREIETYARTECGVDLRTPVAAPSSAPPAGEGA